jgi:uncharacterized protein (TIGR02117 family)
MKKVALKLLKYIGRFIAGFIIFVLLYLLAAYCLSRIATSKESGTSNDVTIYIKTNGVHTDIVMPVKSAEIDWSQEFKFSDTHIKDSNNNHYIAMGWGDKGFYLETPEWSDLKFGVAFKAAFALGRTAIHATFYDTLKQNEACKKIEISHAQYIRLIKYINESLQHDPSGHIMNIVTNANYGDNDAFYEAKGSYSMLHTCNTWANTGLKRCGQRACLWTPFDTGIFLKYK